LAAFLYAQLEQRERIQAQRRRLWEYYHLHLANWAEEHGVRRPTIPAYCEQPYHMYYLLLPSLDRRRDLSTHLNEHGIQSGFHYQPLHRSDMGRSYGGKPGDCPVTEDLSDRLLRFPFHNFLTEDQQATVVAAVRGFRG